MLGYSQALWRKFDANLVVNEERESFKKGDKDKIFKFHSILI